MNGTLAVYSNANHSSTVKRSMKEEATAGQEVLTTELMDTIVKRDNQTVTVMNSARDSDGSSMDSLRRDTDASDSAAQVNKTRGQV